MHVTRVCGGPAEGSQKCTLSLSREQRWQRWHLLDYLVGAGFPQEPHTHAHTAHTHTPDRTGATSDEEVSE